jgi:hypothetical protein
MLLKSGVRLTEGPRFGSTISLRGHWGPAWAFDVASLAMLSSVRVAPNVAVNRMVLLPLRQRRAWIVRMLAKPELHQAYEAIQRLGGMDTTEEKIAWLTVNAG